MDGLRDQLNSVLHLVLTHDDNSCRRPEGLPMPALASDAGEQKACSNEGAEGRCKKDRRALKRWPGVGDIRWHRFRRDVL